MDIQALRVIAGVVGGSFGMKWGPLREEMLVFWAAVRLERAVRWTAQRAESSLRTSMRGTSPSPVNLVWMPMACSRRCGRVTTSM